MRRRMWAGMPVPLSYDDRHCCAKDQGMTKLEVNVGRTVLKNPLIAGSAEHLIEADGVRRALRAGVGAVVVTSTNEARRGGDRLQRAQYMLPDEAWREIEWTPDAPATAFIACRSGLTPQSFETW